MTWTSLKVCVFLMLLWDILKKVNRRAACLAVLLFGAVLAVCCIRGTNYYYGIRWQSPDKIKMLKMLNQSIPSDKGILSLDPSFIVNQHSSKGAHYRPEIAWYLDREITPSGVFGPDGRIMVSESLKDIEEKAKTGRFSYCLVPEVIPRRAPLAPLINQLAQQYEYMRVPGHDGESKYGKFYRAWMPNYWIFDLQSKPSR